MEKEEKKKPGFPNLIGRSRDEREQPAPAPAQPTPSQPQPQTNQNRPMDSETTNNISASLSEQDKKEIYDAINLIHSKLPFAKNYSEEERDKLMRLGDTGHKFIDKAQGLVKNSPGILPRSFDTEEFSRDAELYQELGEIHQKLKKLTNMVADSESAVGGDAFTAALVVYQIGKLARVGNDMDDNLSTGNRSLNIS